MRRANVKLVVLLQCAMVQISLVCGEKRSLAAISGGCNVQQDVASSAIAGRTQSNLEEVALAVLVEGVIRSTNTGLMSPNVLPHSGDESDQDRLDFLASPAVDETVANKKRKLSKPRALMYCGEVDCGFSTKNRCHFDNHVRVHTGEKPFHCTHEGCMKSFARKDSLVKHIQQIHCPRRRHECLEPGCSAFYASADGLRKHVHRDHCGRRYKCDYCERSFTSKRSCSDHMNKHNGLKPYRCEYCSASFTYISNLGSHMGTMHRRIDGGEAKNYECSWPNCGRSFAAKSTRDEHELTHSPERKYVCEHCGRSYKQRAGLCRHKKTFHKE